MLMGDSLGKTSQMVGAQPHNTNNKPNQEIWLGFLLYKFKEYIMNIKELQTWLNDHGATPKLKVDGIAGTLTRVAIIQVFVNKNAKAITEEQLLQ